MSLYLKTWVVCDTKIRPKKNELLSVQCPVHHGLEGEDAKDDLKATPLYQVKFIPGEACTNSAPGEYDFS